MVIKLRRHKTWIQVLASVLAGLLLGVLVIHLMNTRLRPAVIAAAADYLDNQISGEIYTVVESVLEEQQITYDSIYTILLDGNGSLQVLEADLTRLNRLCAAVTTDVAQAFDSSFIEERIDLPLGLAFGGLSFAGHGPKIPVIVESVGNISASYDNEFRAEGINQTLHRVVLHVTAELNLLLPGGVYTYTSETPIVLAETVLLGQVPGSYTYFNETAPSQTETYYYAGNRN